LPRFYFDLRTHGFVLYDPEGVEFPSVEDAMVFAEAEAFEIGAPQTGRLLSQEEILIRSEGGRVVHRVPVSTKLRDRKLGN
jgi:hypothetical protein